MASDKMTVRIVPKKNSCGTPQQECGSPSIPTKKMPTDISSLVDRLDEKKVEKKVEKRAEIQVIHGANDSFHPVVGLTVGQVREKLVDFYNIPPEAISLIDGEEVTSETIIAAEKTLEFIKIAGSKGCTNVRMTKKA